MKRNEPLSEQTPIWQYLAGWVIIVFTVLGITAMLGTLTGCATTAKPESTQITQQGSPSIVVNPHCRENCGAATITTGDTTATSAATADQPVEQTTKSGMWTVWIIVIAMAAAAGAWFYIRKKKG
jgi:hypothetical protein